MKRSQNSNPCVNIFKGGKDAPSKPEYAAAWAEIIKRYEKKYKFDKKGDSKTPPMRNT